MSEKLITLGHFKTGLQASKTYIDAQDATLSDRIDAVVQDIEGIVATGGEANILEGVKVNGVAMEITNKLVDLIIQSGTETGAINVNGVDVFVKGLGALAAMNVISENELDDTLKASIAAKATQADLSALEVRVTTAEGKIATLESAGFQNAEQVSAAIQAAIAEANHLKYKIVDAAPAAADADDNTWYMVYNEETKHYDIYGLLNGEVQIIDDTTIDLTGYSTTAAMEAYVAQQIAALSIDQYATDEELAAAAARITALETALANVYTKEEAEAKFTDETEAQTIAETAAAAAVEAAKASDEEVSTAVDGVFGSEA